ncbi:MAG TPA: NUDIX domain-containing protein [Chlamydiales bacterium]|nr:NUDIX domain-containing protein [Chlamydiales bacterium]
MDHPKSVAGVVFSPDGYSVLLTKRRDVPVWVLPGGGIDPPESPQKAVVREILEETGFTVKVDRLVGDYIPINRLSKRTYLYECTILSGSARLSEETRGVAFFPLAQLPPLPPPYGEWIADAMLQLPPMQKKLLSVNYTALTKNLLLHPILVIRFLLSKAGLTINT